MNEEKLLLKGICLNVMVSILVHACDVNNCIRCFPTNSTRCSRCMKGYYENDGSCSLCPGSCVRCHRRFYCTKCKTGLYGPYCNKNCDTKCGQIKCSQFNGICLHGCRDGYVQSGSTCVQCSNYTKHCEECSDKYNCTKCASGYNLWSSDNVTYCCSPDTWGDKCQYNCSSNCPNTACDVTYGHCDRCSKYKYGDTCQFWCSAGCNDGGDTNVCDRKEGHCKHGCKPGRHCDRVDGQWGQWSGYGPCSVTCGGGSKSRTRSCDNPAPQNGGQPCNGTDLKTKACNPASCPIDGQWSKWSDYEPCSVTCGQGSRFRSRSCNQPAPQNGGRSCSGNDVETTGCYLERCPVDGSWGQWSVYGPCSVTCGEGSMSRSRTCDRPSPQNGGLQCSGGDVEMTSCKRNNCSGDEVDTGTKPGNAKNKDDEISGGDVSSNDAVAGGVIGSVAVCVVLLVVFVIKRRTQREQHKDRHRAIYVNVNPAMSGNLEGETNGMNAQNYESLHERSQHNSTYMELKTTEYENLKI